MHVGKTIVKGCQVETNTPEFIIEIAVSFILS